MTWEVGQTLYRMTWLGHRSAPRIRVTEYTVDRVTNTGGWIYISDMYIGEKPDRTSHTLVPLLDDTHIWRSYTSGFVHTTVAGARNCLARRTRRHMQFVWRDVDKVRSRCVALGIDPERCRPDPFEHLRYSED